MGKSVNERELALEVLMEVTEHGGYSHIVLRETLKKYQYLDKRERAFITRVTEGTLEHMLELDYILDQFSKVKTKKMKPVIRNILRSGVYQLKYMDSVPDSAVCNEAVKLAVRKGFGNLRGFVNGVLRAAARGLDAVQYPVDPLQNMSVRYSMPEWILRLWLNSYESGTVETMLQAFQEETPVTIRCDRTKGTPEELKKQLEQEGVTVERHPYLPYAFQISGYDYLGGLDSFQSGKFYVQDISSMLVCELAAPKAGDRVIDVCAAPGGKSLHMAEMLAYAEQTDTVRTDADQTVWKNTARDRRTDGKDTAYPAAGSVEARDLTWQKVELIEENIRRSGLTNISAVQQDAVQFDPASVEAANIVLADLPCSGLGVLGKKTDLKYKMTEEGVRELVGLQRSILQNVQAYVKLGGKLIYSTCTIDPAENMENVRWFLQQYPEFELCDIRPLLCEQLQDVAEEEGCLQLLPGIQKSDGFFIACMVKSEKKDFGGI